MREQPGGAMVCAMKLTLLSKVLVLAVVLVAAGFLLWPHLQPAPAPGSPGAAPSVGSTPGGAGPSAPAVASSPATPTSASASAAPVPGAAGPAVTRVRDRHELLVGMDTGEPAWSGTEPMYFRNEQGADDGLDSQVARAVAGALGPGVTVKVVHAKYSELPDRLKAKALDVVISGCAPFIDAGLAWSEPYLEFGLCLVVPRKSKVASVADLWGKKVGIFDDEAAAEDTNRLVKGHTGLVRLEDGYWDQLLAGKFAGFVYDYPYAVAEIRKFYAQNPHRKDSLRIAQYNLTESTYAVAVRADEQDLLAAVNAGIRAMRAGDDYRETLRRYLAGGDEVAPTQAGARLYTVEKGDTLGSIAEKALGDRTRWQALWMANKDRFPNPNLIATGAKLVLP